MPPFGRTIQVVNIKHVITPFFLVPVVSQYLEICGLFLRNTIESGVF